LWDCSQCLACDLGTRETEYADEDDGDHLVDATPNRYVPVTGTGCIFGLAEVGRMDDALEKNQADADADRVVDCTTETDKMVHVGGATLYGKNLQDDEAESDRELQSQGQ
jgi:hypothetical protein